MASGNTLIIWRAQDNEPPSSNFATFNLRNNHPVLDFDDTTQETAIFTAILPRNYGGGGITAYLHWVAAATSGTGGWDVTFERIGNGSQDIDSDGFATAQTVTAATVPGTSGNVAITSVAIADGAAGTDSTAVGETFRVRIRRDVANDTAVGDLQLLAIELKET